MAEANPFADCYGSRQSNFATDSSDEERMVRDVPLPSLSSSKLQDKASWRIPQAHAFQRGSKSCDNILLGSQVYQKSDKSKPTLTRASRSMNDILPFRRYGQPFKPPVGMSHGRNGIKSRQEGLELLPQTTYRPPRDVAVLKRKHEQKPAVPLRYEQWSTIAQAATSGKYSLGSEDRSLGDIDLPASSSFTDYRSRDEYFWDQEYDTLIVPDAPNKVVSAPGAMLYTVSQAHAHIVQEFLAEYLDTSHNLPPRGLLVIDVHTPEFAGSVITILTNTDSVNYGPKGLKPRLRSNNKLQHAGESILVPALHKPQAFIDCLLSRHFITLSTIQPQAGKFSGTEQPLVPCEPLQSPSTPSKILANSFSKSPESLQLFNGTSTSIIHEAHQFSLEWCRTPTMAKFPASRNELVWCGWNLLLLNEVTGV